jgi:hypothetical protein
MAWTENCTFKYRPWTGSNQACNIFKWDLDLWGRGLIAAHDTLSYCGEHLLQVMVQTQSVNDGQMLPITKYPLFFYEKTGNKKGLDGNTWRQNGSFLIFTFNEIFLLIRYTGKVISVSSRIRNLHIGHGCTL